MPTTSEKKNPWLGFKHQKPFILKEDRKAISHYNSITKKEEYKIQTDQPPSPFKGNIKAPIILLNLNPGYKKEDGKFYKQKYYIMVSKNNLEHKKNPYPFFSLDPLLNQNSGYEWWNKKLKSLIDLTDVKTVANRIFVLEYFPYHSVKYSHSKKLTSCSQLYNKHLLEMAMKRKALVIIMRGEKEWKRLVPSLSQYPLIKLRSTQNVVLSEKNLRPNFKKVINALKK